MLMQPVTACAAQTACAPLVLDHRTFFLPLCPASLRAGVIDAVKQLDGTRQVGVDDSDANLLEQLKAASEDTSKALALHADAAKQQLSIIETHNTEEADNTEEEFPVARSGAGSQELAAHTLQQELHGAVVDLAQVAAGHQQRVIVQAAELRRLTLRLDGLHALCHTSAKQPAAALALPAAAGSCSAARASEHTAVAPVPALPGPESSEGNAAGAAASEAAEAVAAGGLVTAAVPNIVVAQKQPPLSHKAVLQGAAAAVPTIEDAWEGVDSQVEALLKATFYHKGDDFEAQQHTTAFQLAARSRAVCSSLSENRQGVLAELKQLLQQPASPEQAFSFRLAAQTHQVAGLVRFDEVQALHEAAHRSAAQQDAGQGNSSSAGQLQEGSQGLENDGEGTEQEGSQGGGQQQLESDGERIEDADTETEEGEVPQQQQPAVVKRSVSPSTEAPSLKRQCTGGHAGAERGALSAVENTM